MPIETKKEIELEIAHVLFIDIVGYSKLSINDEHAAVEELNQVVRASEQFQRAEAASRLLKISTGDGIALVIDAALGRKELALDEGRRAIALTPVEKDVINGSRVLQYFAITAAWAGDKELALQQLEAGLRAPAASLMLSYGALKLFPSGIRSAAIRASRKSSLRSRRNKKNMECGYPTLAEGRTLSTSSSRKGSSALAGTLLTAIVWPTALKTSIE